MPLIPDRPAEGVRPVRAIYVTEEIRDRICRNSRNEGFPAVASDKLIATFWAGWYVSISLLGDPDGLKPDLERLHSVDEVWSLCFRRVRQDQWRLLGRFVSKNLYVGLGLYRRSELAGGEYGKKAEAVIYDWTIIHGLDSPLKGNNKNDYLGGMVGNVDID